MEHEHAASLTARAIKKALPDRAIVTREAQRTINSATSVFTLYLASLAHEMSLANKRSTITLKDVLQTLRDADFEHFIEPIEACVQETKAAADRKRKLQDTIEMEDGAETTSEVAAKLDEVAIDTSDKEEDEMSVDDTSDVEDNSGDADTSNAVNDGQDRATAEEERGSQTVQMEGEEDDSAEAMEQS
ncbi:unnamed protein product [Hyaloperonospora brassicae]|uniref:Transcription factor CBF/NF-Y/archaeal histone domain-containing protein n=1 Tax=Hyaloperonospora brassicae TaxID=162125 RepID=A0AAV0U050_HYABA|nr:unnamed protein product [Hyaloperonospora brassicae]